MIYFVLMFFSGRGEILLPNLAAAFLHEAGHFLAMALTGTEVKSVLVTPFGAVIEKGRRLSGFGTDLIVSSAGIAANLLSALLLLPFRSDGRVALFLLSDLVLALLNLLPVGILDGGEMLTAVLSLSLPPDAVRKYAGAASFLSLIPLWCASVYFLFFGEGDPSLFFLTVCLFLTMTRKK
ncbi:MAG: hypothetical protein MJ070_08855 [Lachnospiraceae bacterium]|nr:hypothetical protein [Lachnospiraceae bacterium]